MLKLHTEGAREQAGEIRLSLDELAREGARRMLQEAEAGAVVRDLYRRHACARYALPRAA